MPTNDTNADTATRFELRFGRYGPFFHDTQRGGQGGFDMPLAMVLDKLNRLEECTQRLARANKGRKKTF